jgi:hypothetical protein
MCLQFHESTDVSNSAQLLFLSGYVHQNEIKDEFILLTSERSKEDGRHYGYGERIFSFFRFSWDIEEAICSNGASAVL